MRKGYMDEEDLPPHLGNQLGPLLVSQVRWEDDHGYKCQHCLVTII